MKIRILACGVFEPYLEKLSQNTKVDASYICFDAGLHEYPDRLRLTVQQEIDRISDEQENYDAIVLFYGLCGRGTCEIMSREIPVFIPGVHDCIALFMGSDSAYKKEFAKNSGTFYHTLGWIVKKINPNDMAAVDLYRNYYELGWDQHPEYAGLKKKYGDINAEYILQFAAAWQKNYSRGVYIDLGLDEQHYKEQTEIMAHVFGWQYECIKGDLGYLQELFEAAHTDRVFILPPFSTSKAAGDDRIFYSVSAEEKEQLFYNTETVLYTDGEKIRPHGIGLGIDAGGTYTDAVIFDFAERSIIAKAKALTTYDDLLTGITEVLAKLPHEKLAAVNITSLSTTLATNAIVEGRGCRVGTILYSPFSWFSKQAGLEPCIQVKGALDISGTVLEDIDEAEVLAAAYELIEIQKCMAIAVGGYAALRNPELSAKIKTIILRKYPEMTVICSHEISQKLNAVNSLKTAAANARLIPVIGSLIFSVKKALKKYGIHGRLMIVKGDGTCVNTDTALQRPIETVLSGPASSVSGAKVLTGIENAVIADVGGTTTDIAVLRNGQVDISLNGAVVGDAVMQINAVKISTGGLGGDSRISFSRDRKITVGPVRNIPICYAAAKYPFIAERLEELSRQRFQSAYGSSALDILIYEKSWYKKEMSKDEKSLCRLLEDKQAIFAEDAKTYLNYASAELMHIPMLESIGALKVAHLTPTDIFHIQGKMDKWSTKASKEAFGIFAMLLGCSENELMARIWQRLRYMLLSQLLARYLTDEIGTECRISTETEYMLQKIVSGNNDGISFSFRLPSPLIAIGAPVKDMFEGFETYIGTDVIIPDDADVANAAGAVSGEIVSREILYIRQGTAVNYVIFSSVRRMEANTLAGATQAAVELCKELVTQKVRAAGAVKPTVTVTVFDKTTDTADGGVLFIERRICGTASAGAVSEY